MKGFDKAEMVYPRTAGHFLPPILSETQPEKSFKMLAVASAIPSIKPIIFVFTPNTLERNRGRILITISLEISMKKLVRLTAQTLRGNFLICAGMDVEFDAMKLPFV